MSGGELRRLALARAFFGRPPLIVLDEPETNLDPALVEHLAQSLEVLKQRGAAIVITSQVSELVRIADKVVVLMRDKAAVVYGTRAEFLAATSRAPVLEHEVAHAATNGGSQ